MPTDETQAVEHCPVARAVEVMGDRWSLLIVRDAFDGKHRFSDFQRSLGVAKNILADRLRLLVQAEVLTTRPVAEGSAYQQYVLTERGERLFAVVVALRQWGETQLFGDGEAHSQLIDKASGQTLAPLVPTTLNGTPVAPSDTEVVKVTD